jgi:hypothetical protein
MPTYTTYKVNLAKQTTKPPIWDYATTILRANPQDALKDAYEEWLQSVPPNSLPPLNKCRSQVKELTNNTYETDDIPFALPAKRSQRLLSVPGNDLSSGTLGASAMSLAVSSSAISSDQANAAFYMQLYGHGAALGQLQAAGKNIHDPAIYQSYEYFSNYITSLNNVGLNVTSASGNKVKENSYSGSIKVGDILTDILSLYIPAAELADMTKLFQLLANTSNTKITNFLNFWWNNASYSTSQSSLALGPLVIGNQQQPSFTVVYYNFNYSVTNWRSLFVELHKAKLDVYSSAVTFDYDMDLYNSTVHPVILPKIQKDITQYVASTPFAL